MSRQILSTLIGKTVKQAARLRGGGSALPGLVIEKIDPGFITRTLAQIPHGVVVISGTNGKTTTTKIVVELLEAAGLKVFTNRTGSNFSRGVAAALLGEVDMRGRLDADIAVLELDEAWAVKFVQLVPPRYSLLLNVMRDQLDRFGEIDTAAGFLAKIAQATTDTVVLNRDDPRIYRLHQNTAADVAFFGTTDQLLELMPTDDALKTGHAQANQTAPADVLLMDIDKQTATFHIDNAKHAVPMRLNGVYNLLNAAAALSLVRQITGEKAELTTLLGALSDVAPAFGRGETIVIDGTPIELILVKNPSGFRLSLLSFADGTADTMIAINDNYADGRDVSWLWDVDVSRLEQVAVVSGVRAHDMALRLGYDDITPEIIEPDLAAALEKLLAHHPRKPKHIYCTYTAMMRLRKLLAIKTDVEAIR
ncbi:Mur ligase family protein [Candidatus Nanosynbacter lyticus]|uniref:Mur ligase family protein n=1 Tax=Candidatus Nanosynbacter lyticus TaxID=2093824 RepID=UPI00255785D6|nr:Mur ligase family protein [Candidatus Nanosynbacter lyticus]WLD47057.1 MurT ligase domain-containing protein [Candidatus Nanosynbacter lyticus]